MPLLFFFFFFCKRKYSLNFSMDRYNKLLSIEFSYSFLFRKGSTLRLSFQVLRYVCQCRKGAAGPLRAERDSYDSNLAFVRSFVRFFPPSLPRFCLQNNTTDPDYCSISLPNGPYELYDIRSLIVRKHYHEDLRMNIFELLFVTFMLLILSLLKKKEKPNYDFETATLTLKPRHIMYKFIPL